MSVIDDWAERHIQEALNKGELKKSERRRTTAFT